MEIVVPGLVASRWSRLCDWYTYTTLHVVPEPRSLSFFTIILLLPIALLIPPTVLSHRQLSLVFLPIFLVYGIQTWRADGVLDVITTTGLQWSFVLLACYDPRKDFTRVWWERAQPENGDDKDGEAKLVVREQSYPANLLERVPWLLTLLVSIRLAGWRIGDPSHDSRQPIARTMSRTAFVRRAVNTAVFNYILLDISAFYAQTDSYFTTTGMSVDSAFPYASPPPGLGGFLLSLLHRFPPRVVRCSVLAAQIHGLIAGGFYPMTIPVVGLNALGLIPDEWSPHTWPSFFGDFSALWSRDLRGLWGTWWHQMNRQIHSTPGRVLANGLGLDQTLVVGRLVVMIVAFGFSGWMHMGMIPPEPLSTNVSPYEMRMTVAKFFWAQPVGIAFEYAMLALLTSTIPGLQWWPMAKVVALLWVSVWLCMTLPWLTVPFRELGYWTVYPIPFSILRGITGYGWWAW